MQSTEEHQKLGGVGKNQIGKIKEIGIIEHTLEFRFSMHDGLVS